MWPMIHFRCFSLFKQTFSVFAAGLFHLAHVCREAADWGCQQVFTPQRKADFFLTWLPGESQVHVGALQQTGVKTHRRVPSSRVFSYMDGNRACPNKGCLQPDLSPTSVGQSERWSGICRSPCSASPSH